jgi:hypothetical protein
MPGVSLKNKPANGRPSVSTGAYQIDGIEAMGILCLEFQTGCSGKKSDDRLPSAGG